MKALILTGGQGTRLRPFTCDVPKPLLPVVNKPFLHYQFQVLRRHGIREAILATAYRPELFRREFGSGRGTGLRIRYINESTPLGTGGAVRNALRYIDGTTLVLNGDVLQALDIAAFLKYHRAKKAEASLSLVRVKNPTLYGLVETDDAGRIRRFLEKPSWDEITCNTINAGAYLLEPSVISLIPPDVPYSVERGLFPHLLELGRRFFGFVSSGYWMDIGTVEKYLQVHLDILDSRASFKPDDSRRKGPFLLSSGARILWRDVSHEGLGRVALGRGVSVGPYVRFVGSVCVGARCVIEQGAVLENCVVLSETRIGKGARLERCVVGHGCKLGLHSVIGPGRALADGSVIEKFSQL